MSERIKALRVRFEELQHDGAALSRALRDAAAALQRGRLSVASDLADDVRLCRLGAESLRDELLGASPPAEARANAGAAPSLTTFGAWIERIEEQERARERAERTRAAALMILDQLLRIRCADEPGAAALESCRSGARELQTYLAEADAASLPRDAVELADGTHPWCALVSLVASPETLNDERWGQLHEIVTSVFGRPLAAAVARKRLTCPPAAPKPTLVEPPRVAPLPVRPVERTPPAVSFPKTPVERLKPAPTTGSASPPAAPANRIAELDSEIDPGTPPQRGDAVIVRSDEPKPVAGPRSLPSVRRPGVKVDKNSVTAIAQTALDATGRGRYEPLSRLIAKLLLEGRVGLGYHLASSLEQRRDNDVPALPARLVHALALAAEVRFPLGEVSQQLAADYSEMRTARAPAADAEWTIAWHLLLTAAALRPALLAPGSNASSLLHGSKMIEGLSRLYNYAHRIAIFGDQPQPLDVGAFKRAKSEQSWEHELEVVAGEAEAWIAQSPMRRVRYQPATHCFLRSHWSVMRSPTAGDAAARDNWRTWQTAVDRLHALLAPVQHNEVSDLNRVRAEVERLSDPAEIERIASGAGVCRSVTPIDGASRDALRSVIAEAVGLARRWLQLHETPPERRPAAIPRRAEELLDERRAFALRDEVLSRQDAVLQELKSIGERHAASPLIAAGVACCCRAVEQIRRIFDPDAWVGADEAEPRSILNGELLQIPRLTLNELWLPETTPQELENDILRLLVRGPSDWRTAFESRSDEGDHEATARLLSLDVWTREEAEALAVLREERLEACRTALARDVAATRHQIEEAMVLGLITERDWTQFESETVVVEEAVADTLRFPPWHRRLTEIREGLERRRQYELEKVQMRFDQLQVQKTKK